jgi:hypothetical protein
LYYRKAKVPDLTQFANKYEEMLRGSESAVHKEELEYNYNPYRIQNPQNYSPIYNRLFVLNNTNHNSVGLNSEYHICGGKAVNSTDADSVDFARIHVKSSPLVDPYHYISGKYEKYGNNIGELPTFGEKTEESTRLQRKINDPANCSYVDAFFGYLSSRLKHKYNVFGALDFYGICLGVQDLYKHDITEDLCHLYSTDFFNENLGKRFLISDQFMNEYMNVGSRANKYPIKIDDSSDLSIELDVEEIVYAVADADAKDDYVPDSVEYAGSIETSSIESKELVYESKKSTRSSSASSDELDDTNSSPNLHSDSKDSDSDSDSDSESDSKTESKSGSKSESCSNSESESGSNSESDSESMEEEANIYSYIRNFPVQLIFMEKCDGTLDQLFLENKLDDPAEFASAFMQIIMTLIVYQKAFRFTHNDLHTNNILYIETDAKHVYYKYGGKTYKVPTYGRIFKIIDFGRSIYTYNGEIYCSDSYSRGADAAGQYNSEPYFNPDKPRIDPNPSFDLARLGSSIYDFLDENHTNADIYRTIKRWCTDDSGKNIVTNPNGEERWQGFKLYKMIARRVHKHTPDAQLAFPMFSKFAVKPESVKLASKSVKRWFLDIDEIVSDL